MGEVETNVSVEAHDDGTLTIVHYRSTYRHWWLGEVVRRRGFSTGTIYGKIGGRAVLRLSEQEARMLEEARDQAQELARMSHEGGRL